MKWLIEIEGDRIIRQIPLKKSEYTLGRGQENDIVFGNRKVSRLHALLVREGDAYYAIDKDSVNGVFVNGERVKRRRITCGDEIKLSTEVTLFYLSDGAAEDEKVVQMMNRIWEAIIKKDFLRLKEVTSRIISLDSLDHILNIILEEVITLVGAERGFIALTDDDGEIQTDTSVSHNIPLGEDSVRKSVFSHSTVRRAIANKENVFILNTEDSEADPSKSVVELQIMSIMCSPLLFGDRTVGILYVDSGYQMSDFNEMDRFFFTILADHAAIAIENAKLYDRAQTSNKKLREEIRESEERYRQLVELSPEAIMVHSDGKLVFVNAAALRLLGAKESGEVIGRPVMTIVHPDYQDAVRERIRQELEEGKVFPFQEEKILRLDGSFVEAEVSAARLSYQGKPAVLAIVRDVTERKQMEKELLRAQKLESVGILAGGIAHDFNNILTAVLGNVSLAKMYADPTDDIYEGLVVAEKAALRARELTKQLLTFAKGGMPVKQTASIVDLIRDAAAFALKGSNVKCEFHIPDELWQVEIDAGQMSQVIHNLIINADQAMPEGGTIQLSCENTIVNAQHPLPHLKDGKYVRISIADQGLGIPEEHFPKIFDPYFTTKQKGSGLGLAISYSIIKKHDGYITVESELGTGTTFRIYLPASERKKPLENQVGRELIEGRGKVLIMDDEESVRNTAGKLLTHIGYEVEFARDGSEAIELYRQAKESNEPFDIVIMDLTIPGGVGGKEAIWQLLEMDPDVKAIVSSGYSNDPIMSDPRQYGFSGVIAKPYEIEDLSKVLHRVVS